ncbi:MAG: sigma-70 family RNA polymerase sigma factor [Myxococcota bacterium]
MEDSELLAAIARGDRAAFSAFFHRFAPRINGFLRQSLPASKAEEVAQEVLLRVWRSAAGYDPSRASPATWVFTIARNARIDALRRGGRAEPEPDDPMWVPSAPPSPDEVTHRKAEEQQIRAALDQLPVGQLEVLERAYLQGQTLLEVSESLSVPLGTVKSRVRLALERLRGVLPEPGTG